MSVQPQYLEYILEQLGDLGGVTSRRMFGGVGLYRGELFFGLIDDDTLFYKTDASNSALVPSTFTSHISLRETFSGRKMAPMW